MDKIKRLLTTIYQIKNALDNILGAGKQALSDNKENVPGCLQKIKVLTSEVLPEYSEELQEKVGKLEEESKLISEDSEDSKEIKDFKKSIPQHLSYLKEYLENIPLAIEFLNNSIKTIEEGCSKIESKRKFKIEIRSTIENGENVLRINAENFFNSFAKKESDFFVRLLNNQDISGMDVFLLQLDNRFTYNILYVSPFPLTYYITVTRKVKKIITQ